MNSDHYIIQQINVASKLGAKSFVLTRKGFYILQNIEYLRKIALYGRLPVLFSPFYSDPIYLNYGVENIVIQTPKGRMTVYTL